MPVRAVAVIRDVKRASRDTCTDTFWNGPDDHGNTGHIYLKEAA